jgi:hypothetical protein
MGIPCVVMCCFGSLSLVSSSWMGRIAKAMGYRQSTVPRSLASPQAAAG